MSAKGSPTKRSHSPAGSPQKKPKTEAGVVRKQVEYYLSDDNLQMDKFFREKIASNKEGWLELSQILNCNKIKKLGIVAEDIEEAVRDSETVEVGQEAGKMVIRRKGNKPLPSVAETGKGKGKGKGNGGMKLSKDGMDSRKKAHDGGVLVRVSNLKEEILWKDVSNALSGAVPGEGQMVTFCSNVNDGECNLLFKPFEDDLTYVESGKLFEKVAKIEEHKEWKIEVLYGNDLVAALRKLPTHITRKRETRARDRQRERNQPILLAEQRFPNINTARQRVKEILSSRKLGSELQEDSADFRIVKAVLMFHPRAEAKMKGFKGIKIDKSKMDSRCFHIVREDGSTDDVSVVKAFAAMADNPPYASKKEEKKESPKKPVSPQK